MNSASVPFNRPYRSPRELEHISQVLNEPSAGQFVGRCEAWFEQHLGTERALLTNSCSAALDIAVSLSGAGLGDEVIMPSFNYMSAANAVVAQGATPVFVDVLPETLNIDAERVGDAIGPRTKAIVSVDYAGVPCERDAVAAVVDGSDAVIIQDAAQALLSKYKGRLIGSDGPMITLSFHSTKNVVSGQGGVLLLNDEAYSDRAEIIRDNGTDRASFYAGRVEEYSWVDRGSQSRISELAAAYLLAQLECAGEITSRRRRIWQTYHDALTDLERKELIRRPELSQDVAHNGHMYWLLIEGSRHRKEVVRRLRDLGVDARPHFVPLHSSAAGMKYGKCAGHLQVSEHAAQRLIRLPLWVGVEPHVGRVIESLERVLS